MWIKSSMFFSATGWGVNDSRRLSRPSQAFRHKQTLFMMTTLTSLACIWIRAMTVVGRAQREREREREKQHLSKYAETILSFALLCFWGRTGGLQTNCKRIDLLLVLCVTVSESVSVWCYLLTINKTKKKKTLLYFYHTHIHCVVVVRVLLLCGPRSIFDC